MANELPLKYGCNPNQKPSRIFMKDGRELPVTVLNGKPGYINFLDALNSWPVSYTHLDVYKRQGEGIPSWWSPTSCSPGRTPPRPSLCPSPRCRTWMGKGSQKGRRPCCPWNKEPSRKRTGLGLSLIHI